MLIYNELLYLFYTTFRPIEEAPDENSSGTRYQSIKLVDAIGIDTLAF